MTNVKIKYEQDSAKTLETGDSMEEELELDTDDDDSATSAEALCAASIDLSESEARDGRGNIVPLLTLSVGEIESILGAGPEVD